MNRHLGRESRTHTDPAANEHGSRSSTAVGTRTAAYWPLPYLRTETQWHRTIHLPAGVAESVPDDIGWVGRGATIWLVSLEKGLSPSRDQALVSIR